MARCSAAAVLVALFAAVCSCGGSNPPPDPSVRIQGTWVSDDGRVSTFSRSGEFSQVYREETYFSLWEVQGDSIRFTGTSSTNPYYEADPDYVGYAPFSFDAEGNLILDGKKYTRQE